MDSSKRWSSSPWLLITLVLGLGCVYLARRVQQGDRVARVLAIVVCLTIGSACILTSARDLGWVLSAVVALATAGLLAFDPAVKAHFLGEDAAYGAERSAVVTARVLLVCVACAVILVGIMFLPVGAYEPSLIAVGLIAVWHRRLLPLPEPAPGGRRCNSQSGAHRYRHWILGARGRRWACAARGAPARQYGLVYPRPAVAPRVIKELLRNAATPKPARDRWRGGDH